MFSTPVPTPTLTPTQMIYPLQIVHSTTEVRQRPTVRPVKWDPTPEPTLTLVPTITPTPLPYYDLTIEALMSRSYGDGQLEIVDTLSENSYFTRYLIRYPSDGLVIYGFMNVPVRGEPPYPVVIALHGYVDPGYYQTLDYTTGYADTLARAGYLVVHPNLRGYPPSDSGPNLFRVGMAVDVLNLVALVKAEAGLPGPLVAAKPDSIGLWGHSMGGGIAMRVITISPEVDAAVLYGSLSGDELKNYEAIYQWMYGKMGSEELAMPLEAIYAVSPVFHIDRIQAAVSIHHGESDEIVPLNWSLDTCLLLHEIGHPVECFTYPGERHTFSYPGEELFMRRVIDFFDRYL